MEKSPCSNENWRAASRWPSFLLIENSFQMCVIEHRCCPHVIRKYHVSTILSEHCENQSLDIINSWLTKLQFLLQTFKRRVVSPCTFFISVNFKEIVSDSKMMIGTLLISSGLCEAVGNFNI